MNGNRIEYATEGGPELGVGLHETEISLRVDGDTGVAFLERHQPSSDEGGEAIGTFRTVVAGPLRERLLAAVAKADLRSVPPGTGGGPGVSLIRIRRTRGDVDEEARFSSRDFAQLQRLEPLTEVFDEITREALGHPFQALQAEVALAPAAAGHLALRVTVRNVGTESVAFVDLRDLPPPRPEHLDEVAGVRVAPYPPAEPGITAPPLSWTLVPLGDRRPAGRDPLIVLAPGATVSAMTEPFTAPAPGVRHLVQALVSHYAGAPTHDGHLVVRGRLLSEAIEVRP